MHSRILHLFTFWTHVSTRMLFVGLSWSKKGHWYHIRTYWRVGKNTPGTNLNLRSGIPHNFNLWGTYAQLEIHMHLELDHHYAEYVALLLSVSYLCGCSARRSRQWWTETASMKCGLQPRLLIQATEGITEDTVLIHSHAYQHVSFFWPFTGCISVYV